MIIWTHWRVVSAVTNVNRHTHIAQGPQCFSTAVHTGDKVFVEVHLNLGVAKDKHTDSLEGEQD